MSYSAPLSADVLYRDFNHQGRLTIDRIREILPSSNYHFFLCGPGPMMESLVPELMDWGVPESHIHYEAFGPASVKSGRGAACEATKPCEVRFGAAAGMLCGMAPTAPCSSSAKPTASPCPPAAGPGVAANA